jgi:general secretion pathway protein H
LLELLVVLVIIGVAGAGVTFALRDNDSQRLEREAQRLIAQLEGARSESRASGQPLYWRPTSGGYEFVAAILPSESTPSPNTHRPWLDANIQAEIRSATANTWVALGPEPLIPPQSITLRLGPRALEIATNGWKAFAIRSPDSPLAVEAAR